MHNSPFLKYLFTAQKKEQQKLGIKLKSRKQKAQTQNKTALETEMSFMLRLQN